VYPGRTGLGPRQLVNVAPVAVPLTVEEVTTIASRRRLVTSLTYRGSERSRMISNADGRRSRARLVGLSGDIFGYLRAGGRSRGCCEVSSGWAAVTATDLVQALLSLAVMASAVGILRSQWGAFI
jgi:hypothetical protein